MMDQKNLDLKELKDSKILYMKDMPKFGYYLLLILFVVMALLVIGSIFVKKPYIVSARGYIQGMNKNYIMSEYAGKIYDMDIREGQDVKEGQILFKLKSSDINMQIKELETRKIYYEKTVSKYSTLIKSIKDNKNHFSSKAEDSLYSSQYNAYVAKLKQQVVNEKALQDYGYNKEQLLAEQEKNESARDEIYYDAINAAANSQKQYQQEVDNIESRILALKSGQEDYIIKSNANGKIHFLGKFKNGMTLQSSTPIASISDSKSSNLLIEATVAADDRSRIEVGDTANIVVAGLQQNIYGSINGKVIEIDTDVSTSETGKQQYFNIKIKPNNTVLKSKYGKIIELKNGMAVESRIVYDRITYFNYIMNALGVKVGIA